MAVGGATVPRAFLPQWGTAVGPCRVPHGGRCIVLQIFLRAIYFCKIEVKKYIKKEKILVFDAVRRKRKVSKAYGPRSVKFNERTGAQQQPTIFKTHPHTQQRADARRVARPSSV
jgi:hypothetical protein